MKRRVLFLCTGNYYRSRFAELLFNHLAAEAGLDWQAESRGIVTELASGLPGPMSQRVVAGLEARGIRPAGTARYPLQLRPADLEAADLLIALDEQEHRRFLARLFPGWAERVTYWHVHDLGEMPADVALATVEQEVRRLIDELASGKGPGRHKGGNG